MVQREINKTVNVIRTNAFGKEMGCGQEMRKPYSINIPNAKVQLKPPVGSSDKIDNKRLMTAAEKNSFHFAINKPWKTSVFSINYRSSAEDHSNDFLLTKQEPQGSEKVCVGRNNLYKYQKQEYTFDSEVSWLMLILVIR